MSFTASARAGSDLVSIMAAESTEIISDDQTTHGTIRLTMDKSELVRLDHDAASVIVGNPNHVSVLSENTKLLVLVPRQPGATYMTVLGQSGNILMQRHIIVDAPKEKYVRIRKSCAGQDAESCQTTQTYYCPDMCHQIVAPTPSDNGAQQAATTAAQSGADVGGEQPPYPLPEETE